jgi:PAS domain S-box-containing protein
MKRTKKTAVKALTKKPQKKGQTKNKVSNREKIGDIERLVHLLQVHQIELEHQNHELRLSQEELEISRNKYVNLFDFSPIPYFTLDFNGVIKEVNIIASKKIGIERRKLIGRNIITFIPMGEKETFHAFIKEVFNSSEKKICYLKAMNKDKRIFDIRLEAVKLAVTFEPDTNCYVALIDLTEYKKV